MHKQRNRSWRRFQNYKIIRKRLNIIKNYWSDTKYNPDPGRLRKWNFTCGCRMCNMSEYFGKKDKRERENARACQVSDY